MGETPKSGNERDSLEAFLDAQRDAVIRKASGLSDADAAARLLPSLTTVSGLIRHLADVERGWFRGDLDGQTDVPYRETPDDPDGDFRVSDDDTLAEIITDYKKACAESNRVAARFTLNDLCEDGDGHSLRWIYLHMIEETARHAGHIDILRELLDGVVGE
jgi:uncharacterized damage-inducible protein DinB